MNISPRKKSLLDKIDQLKIDMENSINQLQKILEKNKADNLEEFSKALEKKSLYEKHIKKWNLKRAIK